MALVAVPVAFAACTSEGDPTPTATVEVATPTSSTATATPQPTATSTAPPSPDLTTGGVLRFAVKQAPPHQDVHQSVSSVLATWGAGITYSRLFKFQRGPSVAAPSRIPECDLCTAWRQTGPLEFEFDIREDAFWPDLPPLNGRRVTAADIVFSYQRQMTPGWPNAGLLSNVREIVAVEDNLLRISLESPDAELFEKLADGRSVVVAEEIVQLSGDLVDGPTVGSGPWLLEGISQDDATFIANRSYYGEGPHLDGLAIQFIEQDSTRAAGVRADILDFAETTPAEVQSALERFPELRTMEIGRSGARVELAINATRSPLDSRAVRQAVFLSWDPEVAMTDIWDSELTPSVGLNVSEPSWEPDFETEFSGLFGDGERARGLVQDAGLTAEDILRISVGEFGETGDADRYVLTARSLAEAMTSAGFEVMVERVTTRSFADDVWLQGNYDIFVGAPPPVSSLSGQLFSTYHSDGPWNTSGFSNSRLDELIEQQAVELDRQRRGELLLEIHDEIMGEALRFYPGIGSQHWLWQPRVRDVVPDTSGASGDFLSRIWISRE